MGGGVGVKKKGMREEERNERRLFLFFGV
jgi:hypothetical protein